jgi:hypothetical protein
MKKIKYTVSLNDLDYEELIKDAIKCDPGILEYLIGDLSAYDMRAEYVEDSFSIQEVRIIDDKNIEVYYSYEWHAHYGCKDMIRDGAQDHCVNALVMGKNIQFEFNEVETKSTFEEL